MVKHMGVGTVIEVNYNKVPAYCKYCCKIGHVEAKCLAKEMVNVEKGWKKMHVWRVTRVSS